MTFSKDALRLKRLRSTDLEDHIDVDDGIPLHYQFVWASGFVYFQHYPKSEWLKLKGLSDRTADPWDFIQSLCWTMACWL